MPGPVIVTGIESVETIVEAGCVIVTGVPEIVVVMVDAGITEVVTSFVSKC